MLYEKADLQHLKRKRNMENHGLSVQRLKFTLYIKHPSEFSEGKGHSFKKKKN